eukprot:m.25603 g.25603  ORF g.25603 m.25603 type:complete len:382 (-) comp4188_c0_seq1:3906-5051(-)
MPWNCGRDPRTHTLGMVRMRQFRLGIPMANLPAMLRWDVFFIALRLRWREMFLLFVALYLAIALLFSALYAASECVSGVSFGQIYFIVLGSLLQGPGPSKSIEMDPFEMGAGCLLLFSMNAMTGLVLSAFVFALVIKKFLVPQVDVWFTKYLVQNVRDGRPVLQIRVVPLRGRPIVGTTIVARMLEPTVSREGERFTKMTDLNFDGASILYFPCTYSHFIDDASPLSGANLATKPFQLFVQVTGFDTVLGQRIQAMWFYECPSDLVLRARFANIVIPLSPEQLALLRVPARNKKELCERAHVRNTIDMLHFHEVVSIDDDIEATPSASGSQVPIVAWPAAKPSAIAEEMLARTPGSTESADEQGVRRTPASADATDEGVDA